MFGIGETTSGRGGERGELDNLTEPRFQDLPVFQNIKNATEGEKLPKSLVLNQHYFYESYI